MLYLYRLLFLPLGLILLPKYLIRSWRRGGIGEGWANRFGWPGKVPAKRAGIFRIWIQAVSVGELHAVLPLIEKLHRSGRIEICLTVTTVTARRLARGKASAFCVWQGFFPLDWWLFSRRMWRKLQPNLAILTETELWPEFLHQADRANTPVWLINARLSDRSYRRYSLFPAVSRRVFGGIDRILAGTKQDLSRYENLGFGRKREFGGNLKCDVADDPLPQQLIESLRKEVFPNQEECIRVLLGASTWPGEEELLVKAWQDARLAGTGNLILLIVPRHAERRESIRRNLNRLGVTFQFRSERPQREPDCLIYVADTTGELRALTTFADVVFIGKSMPPHREGQTPIEAAAAGRPAIMGPGMANFRDVTHLLRQVGGAIQVHNPEELSQQVISLLQSPDKRREIGEAARSAILRNSGATESMYQEIISVVDQHDTSRDGA